MFWTRIWGVTNFHDFMINLEKREWKVWNDLDIPPATSISMTSKLYSEWLHDRSIHNNSSPHQPHVQRTTWEPPPTGFLTCNLEAALFDDIQAFGSGFCILGEDGIFIKTRNCIFNGSPTPAQAEEWALLLVIQWITDLEFRNVIFESNCKFVVDSCNKSLMGNIELHVIFAKCRAFLSNITNSRVSLKGDKQSCCLYFDKGIQILCL